MSIEKLSNNEAAEFLLRSGLLWECNWKILHPFGLALCVKENEDSGVIEFDGIMKTDDLKGWAFNEHDFLLGLHKLRRFVIKKENIERLSARKLSLGCAIQNESDRDIHTAPIQEGLV